MGSDSCLKLPFKKKKRFRSRGKNGKELTDTGNNVVIVGRGWKRVGGINGNGKNTIKKLKLKEEFQAIQNY